MKPVKLYTKQELKKFEHPRNHVKAVYAFERGRYRGIGYMLLTQLPKPTPSKPSKKSVKKGRTFKSKLLKKGGKSHA